MIFAHLGKDMDFQKECLNQAALIICIIAGAINRPKQVNAELLCVRIDLVFTGNCYVDEQFFFIINGRESSYTKTREL